MLLINYNLVRLVTKDMVFGKKKDDDKEEGKDGGGDAGGDAKDDDDDGKKGKDKGESVQMRAGDYMIHLYLEKLKELNVKEGETMDPMI